jgi:hypothetical protein
MSAQENASNYNICKKAKSEHVSYPGLLQPLLVPKQAWQTINMDFMEGLPRSKGANNILVVVDKFTKYSHFIPLSHPFTAKQVAEASVDNVYKLHGLGYCVVQRSNIH